MGLIRKRKKRVNAPKCEKCGATTIPIVYGYPSGSMFRDAALGKIVLGGCVIFGNDQQWTCSAGCDVKKSGEKIDT